VNGPIDDLSPGSGRCSEVDCSGVLYARGLCMTHWQRFRKAAIEAGTWQPIPASHEERGLPRPVCVEVDCERAVYGRERCTAHYRQHRAAMIAAGTWNATGTGQGWHGDSERHAKAGRKGGTSVSSDRDHMSSIGKRGGITVGRDSEHMASIGSKGGQTVSADREHMRAIGAKGGRVRRKTTRKGEEWESPLREDDPDEEPDWDEWV
jgi:general stress protein YciG